MSDNEEPVEEVKLKYNTSVDEQTVRAYIAQSTDPEVTAAFERLLAFTGSLRTLLEADIGPAVMRLQDIFHERFRQLEDSITKLADRVFDSAEDNTANWDTIRNALDTLVEKLNKPAPEPRKPPKKKKKKTTKRR